MVQSARLVGTEWQYDVFLGDEGAVTYPERSLISADVKRDSITSRLADWSTHLDAAAFRRALTVIQLKRPLQQNLYSYLGSRTELQPYQFKPVLKLLRSPYGRMFIADEVGLGKTIEAGIIMTEYAARTSMDRVLICCPPALLYKWKSEMLERFDREFEVMNGPRMREIFSNPDFASGPLRVIVSLHLLRRAEMLELLSGWAGRFDLVVVDESHHMQNSQSRSHAAGEALSDCTEQMLMLSATPLSLRTADLFHQLRILVPEEFFDLPAFDDRIAPNGHLNNAIRALRRRPADHTLAQRHLESAGTVGRLEGSGTYEEAMADLRVLREPASDAALFAVQLKINELNTIGHVFTRTRKREVREHFPTRRANVIQVTPTAEETEFYDAVTAFVRAQNVGSPSFASIMPQRQVASSIPAAREYLRARWGSHMVEAEEDALAEFDEDVSEPVRLEQISPSRRLQEAWAAVEGFDTKFDRFAEALEKYIGDGIARDGKVMVFSFFRKTIELIARRLQGRRIGGSDLRVSVLYGPTERDERSRIVEAFREEPGPHILVCSEVAGEGLDFEFVNVMVNYDLPWNPMRVEQRIGRLDRYGQEAEVIHILNMSVAGTIEERILELLFNRINLFESAIGDLETILGNEIQELTRHLFDPNRTPEEEALYIRQAAENILRRQHEAESFEEESKGLLGQDDLFSEEFDQIRTMKRYISPEQVRDLVTAELAARVPGVRVRRNVDAMDGLDGIAIPPGQDGVRELMRTHLTRLGDQQNRRAWRAVGAAAPGETWRVTFRADIATRHRSVDFITPTHPLVAALLAETEVADRPVTALRVRGASLVPGRYVFLVFLLQIHGARRGFELAPVALRVDGAVDPELSEQLLSALDEATSWTEPLGFPNDVQIELAHTRAEEWAATFGSERQTQLRRANDQILDRRVASLNESTQRLVDRQTELLNEARRKGQDSIVRLREGLIARKQSQLRTKLAEIEGQRHVDIGRELLAGGFLLVDDA
jgi:superfamily II DNA or RNA helicase